MSSMKSESLCCLRIYVYPKLSNINDTPNFMIADLDLAIAHPHSLIVESPSISDHPTREYRSMFIFGISKILLLANIAKICVSLLA